MLLGGLGRSLKPGLPLPGGAPENYRRTDRFILAGDLPSPYVSMVSDNGDTYEEDFHDSDRGLGCVGENGLRPVRATKAARNGRG